MEEWKDGKLERWKNEPTLKSTILATKAQRHKESQRLDCRYSILCAS
jgi:hypothetical protein